MLKNKKILISSIIIGLIIIAGIIVFAIKGFNLGLMYSENTRLELYISSGFNKDEIKEIAKEILEKEKFVIQTSDTSSNIVVITAKTISEEQINNIVEKVNEKYNIEINKEEEQIITYSGKVNVLDIVAKYTAPMIISTLVILAYMLIKYRKQNLLKIIGVLIGSIIIVQLLYWSIFVITRIPVSIYTMPKALILFLITIIGTTIYFETKK